MTARLRAGLGALTVALLALGGALVASPPQASAVAGLVDGYVYELDGTTPIVGATVIFDDGSVPYDYAYDTTDASGHYSFTPDAGWEDAFAIVVLGGNDHLDGFDVGDFEIADPASGEVDDILLGPGRRITGIVRDAATGLPLEDVVVAATGDDTGDTFVSLPPTAADGLFSVGVSPGDDYALLAVKGPAPTHDPQFYEHLNASSYRLFCGCTNPDLIAVPTTGAPITGVDFDLYAYDEWIYLSIFADDLAGDPKHPLLVHLDRRTGPSTWDLDVDTEPTDSDGFADLFALGDGDYRLRFSVGGAFVKAHSWYEPALYPTHVLSDGGRSVELPGLSTSCGCSGFAELLVDLTFPLPSSGGGGSGGSGGGGGGAPGGRPGGSGAVGGAVVTPVVTPTPTPSATPTSTPTPTAEPTDEPEPAAEPSPTPDPVPAGDAGFPWWILLIIALVAGIVITIVVLVRRR